MRKANIFFVIILYMVLSSCGTQSESTKKYFSIQTAKDQESYVLGETLQVAINNPKNKKIDSVVYYLNNTKLQTQPSFAANELIDTERLGNQQVKAIVHFEGEQQEVVKKIIFLNKNAPKLYSYKILAEYPHDQDAFTQGLEFENDTLYESTGKKGASSLRKINYKTGEILKQKDIDNQYFAEGITILKDKIYQLTWHSGQGFIYDLNKLEKIGDFAYNQSKEGWGLCNDGKTIYKSDGTEKIWLLDGETLAEKGYIEVTTNKGVKSKFNELEWVDGKIYANTWQKDGIAIINPKNGALEAVINLTGIRKNVAQHDQLNVLNGIAYNDITNQLFVTGKYWNKLFAIEVVE